MKPFFLLFTAAILAACTPHYRHQDLRETLEGFRQERRTLAPPGGYRDYPGTIHVHTELSHDSDGTIEEIVEASRKAGNSFVITTDHHDRRVYERGFQGWSGGVLVVRGSEITTECRGRGGAGCNSLLVLGLDEPIDETDLSMADVVSKVKALGGLAFAAHPAEGFVDWQAPIDGMEIYDVLDDAVDKKWKFAKWFFDVLYSYRKYRDEVFLSILDPPTKGLRRFDELTQTRRITAIAGNDSHQNTRYLGFLLDPYDLTLGFVRTHVLAPTLDREELLGALAAGRAYVSFDILADATGFGFWAEKGEVLAGVMGDEIRWASDLRLRVEAPLSGRIRVVRDGRIVEEAMGSHLALRLSEPGVYRAEVSLRLRRGWLPWIYSNPLYVRESPSGPRRP
jgi:hypothetical protein